MLLTDSNLCDDADTRYYAWINTDGIPALLAWAVPR